MLGLLVGSRRASRHPAGGGSWAGAAMLFVYALAFSLAYLRLDAGTGALVLFAAVQVTMVGGGISTGHRPARREWWGLLISLAGLVLLVAPGLAAPDPIGALLMAGAGAAWGLYSLRGRATADPVAANAASFARAVPLALAASLAFASEAHADARGLVLAAACGAVTSGLGYAIWYRALPGLTPAQAAIVQLAVPVLAAVGGVGLLGETVTLRLLVAGALVIGGIGLAVRGRRPA